MKLRKNMEGDSRPINLVLLAISFIIFGVLGIVFITQMELQPGWAWEEIRDIYPLGIDIFQTDDVNNNGQNDIIGYADIRGADDPNRYPNIQYGAVFLRHSQSAESLKASLCNVIRLALLCRSLVFNE